MKAKQSLAEDTVRALKTQFNRETNLNERKKIVAEMLKQRGTDRVKSTNVLNMIKNAENAVKKANAIPGLNAKINALSNAITIAQTSLEATTTTKAALGIVKGLTTQLADITTTRNGIEGLTNGEFKSAPLAAARAYRGGRR